MKTTTNKSIKASSELLNRAINAGICGEIIQRSKPSHRRYSANGSTHSPQKVLVLNGIRMSLGQAKQYIAAREV